MSMRTCRMLMHLVYLNPALNCTTSPALVANTSVSVTGMAIGSVATYTCSRDYETAEGQTSFTAMCEVNQTRPTEANWAQPMEVCVGK